MALKIIDHGSTDYQQMVDLRHEILRKPLGLNFSQEELDREKHDILIAAFEEEQMLGCCLLVAESNEECRLRQMAVLNTLRGKGVGRALMIFAENIARDRGFKKMSMHARASVLGFYEKLGYTAIGDEFVEVTIPHYMMEKELCSIGALPQVF